MNFSKHTFSLLFFVGSISLILSSCSSDNNINNEQGQGTETTSNNSNSNLQDPQSTTHRLEFPKLKGGSSIILTHTLEDGEINYSVEWDTSKKSNRWTCYQRYASNSRQTVSRKPQNSQNLYPQDPLFPQNAFFDYDPYRSSGYDHGHLCPSQDRVNSRTSNDQTFYLSNMQPQLHNFNAGIWQVMENKMRTYVTINSTDTLFICRGGTIDNSSQYFSGRGGWVIPQYYFSAALLKYRVRGQGDWQYKAIGFWFKHENNTSTSLRPYVVSIAQLQQNTGIDFFCNLPDDIENRVENQSVDQMIVNWNIQ